MILISNVLFINSVICDDFVRLFVTISFGHLWRNPAIASNNKQCRGDRSGRPVQSRPSKSRLFKSIPITPVLISSVPPFPPFQYSRPSRTTALRHVYRAIRPIAPTFRGWLDITPPEIISCQSKRRFPFTNAREMPFPSNAYLMKFGTNSVQLQRKVNENAGKGLLF